MVTLSYLWASIVMCGMPAACKGAWWALGTRNAKVPIAEIWPWHARASGAARAGDAPVMNLDEFLQLKDYAVDEP